ncbi:MAG: phosphoenolpyruvate synthase, partial [Anaerolineae bacterium]|nr:phosphoenolpyruvate synthase [Anaerolineae bacterium]
MTDVKLLDELERSSLPLAGGKGANLGALLQAGFPVPPGFCVTTDAYRAFVEANHLQEDILRACENLQADNPAALEAASTTIRSRFAAGKIPTDIADAIRCAYADLNRQSIAVAVRSSATAEDLPDMSFAGQQDTYLNIVGEAALLKAVVDCWGSLWTARAIGYRARNGIAQGDVALAVVVQQMVPSEASGVLFTANPLTGKRSETVIDATLGLGEALVSGQVEPDHYVVDDGQILRKTLGAKALSIRGQSGGGTQTVTEDASTQQALPDEQILELAALGRRIEQAFGAPQDIEWAWAEGRLSIVQSRPITSLYPMPIGIRDGEFLVLFSLGAIQGMLDPFTPFGADGFRLMMVAFSKVFGVRVTVETIRGFFEAGSRLFLNTTPLFRSSVGRGVLGVFMGAIEPGSRDTIEMLMDDPRLVVRKGRLKLKTRLGFLRIIIPILFTVIPNQIAPVWGRKRLLRKIETVVGDIAARHAAVRSLDERLDVIESVMSGLPVFFFRWLIPGVASGQVPMQLLLRLCADLPDGERAVLELTRGLPHNVTTEMDLALWRTACTIKADKAAAQHFVQTDAAILAAEYLGGTLPPVAQRALDNFMEHYGARGVGEIDMGRARWREEPASLIQALRSYLQIGDDVPSPDIVFRRGTEAAEEAKAKLLTMIRQSPGGRFKAWVAGKMIHRVRELVGLRESPKFAAIRIMTAIRRGLLTDAGDLVAAGLLNRPDDIFFLRLADLRALAAGTQ